jgi:predicted ATP-dependent protease
VILPKRNDRDLIDVPKKVQQELKITFVDHMDQVLDIALLPTRTARRKSNLRNNEFPEETAAKPSSDQASIAPQA